MAAVYAANGQTGMVYTSSEGLDEMAPTGPVSIWEFSNGEVTESEFDPTVELGLDKVTVADLKVESRSSTPSCSVTSLQARTFLSALPPCSTRHPRLLRTAIRYQLMPA